MWKSRIVNNKPDYAMLIGPTRATKAAFTVRASTIDISIGFNPIEFVIERGEISSIL